MSKLVHFEPNLDDLKVFGDGGVSIIDQIICAHAKFFIGTQESTFSFRIQEEREILGFELDTTFNTFCNENINGSYCKTGHSWLIKY
jgi:peptide-O-fucosyltransferase